MCRGPPVNFTDSVVDVVSQLNCDVTTTAPVTSPANRKQGKSSLIVVFSVLIFVVVVSAVVLRRSRRVRRMTTTSMGPMIASSASGTANSATCCSVFSWTRSRGEQGSYEEAQEEQLMDCHDGEEPSNVMS